ncbi:MAG: AMP-binding protein, partial [Rubrivivax sp.]
MNDNLFVALRNAFPVDLDTTAIETADGPGAPRHYTWRDLDRASAMMANLLASLDLPPASRVAVQVDKSVEALMLYLAVLRSGHVFLPLNTAYQAGEVEYFIGNAEPAVFVCTPGQFAKLSTIAFKAGTGHVFTLGDTIAKRIFLYPISESHRFVQNFALSKVGSSPGKLREISGDE